MVDIPAILSPADIESWDREVDVVVVGQGVAGTCAALEAHRAGADVLIIERASGGGGASGMSSGIFYLGGGTPVQQAAGYPDSADEMANFLMASCDPLDPNATRNFCNDSAAHFDWLEQQGVHFDRSFYPEKSVVQPTRECLIWTGNEQVWPYRDMAHPAPRGHKVAFDGEEGGGALALRILNDKAIELGVEMLVDSKVEALVSDGTRIVGVKLRCFGETRYIQAIKGIVLAAGGFGQNAEMLAKHVPILQSTFVQGSPYDDGLAIQLGEAAGGVTEFMEEPFLTSPFYPPQDLLKGVLVNGEGKRFVAEDSYHSRTGILSTRQPGGTVYLIVDAEIFAYPRFAELTNPRLIDGFETIAEMEAALALPDGSLQATMTAYNSHAANGEDPEFHKYPKWLKPLAKGPYAAFDLSFGTAVYTGFTLGGLKVSADGEVMDAAGHSVSGLYAAGACASNLAQDSISYASGTCLGEASFFGRRAGRHAASL